MQDDVLGRVLRALRHRKGWRQTDVAARTRIACSVIGDLEAGRLGPHRVDALRSVVAALGGFVRIDVRAPGGDVSRLLDADHAALQEHWSARLSRDGWVVATEVTFSHYGERGSIDILAWHAASATLLVVEIKTVIVDIQALAASVDRRTRNAGEIARARGWRPRSIVPALMILDGTTARHRIDEHPALFARFRTRGWPARAWLRDPVGSPGGLLCFTKLPAARPADRRRAGRQRIRRPVARPRSGGASDNAADGRGAA